jgi:gentisate 1,2-dioxygenase
MEKVKSDVADFLEEILEDLNKVGVKNLWDKFDELAAWHKSKQIHPIFQWQLAEIRNKIRRPLFFEF